MFFLSILYNCLYVDTFITIIVSISYLKSINESQNNVHLAHCQPFCRPFWILQLRATRGRVNLLPVVFENLMTFPSSMQIFRKLSGSERFLCFVTDPSPTNRTKRDRVTSYTLRSSGMSPEIQAWKQ